MPINHYLRASHGRNIFLPHPKAPHRERHDAARFAGAFFLAGNPKISNKSDYVDPIIT
ncbi:MAG TPA: hypothetical protein PK677_04550 [Acidiphilium sp.]|nr:hypothetical protein [Acidiphilium sp.]HQU23804.1 hypothetical protein [Acidiphilium sp.]